jgi:hypothetical protein
MSGISKPRFHFEPNALLAGERNTLGFDGFIGIDSGKSDRHHLAFPSPAVRRMSANAPLVTSPFHLPFPDV